MRLGIVGLQADCLLQSRDRFLGLATLGQGDAEVVLRLSRIRPDTGRFAQIGQSLVGLSLLS